MRDRLAEPVRPAFAIQIVIGLILFLSHSNALLVVAPYKRRNPDDKQIQRPQNQRLNGMAVLMHGHGFFVLIAALAVDEDKRAQRHAAPIALVEGQDCAVVIGVLAPDIFQEKQKPQDVLNRAPGEL